MTAAQESARLARPAWQGFWIGGYEGADHVNGHGVPLDMAHASGHWDRLEEDHRRAAQAGLNCVRESIGWRLCEDAGGAIDLSRAVRIQASARRHGLQVLWTLMHYGLPGDLSLHDDALIPRLARFAAEVARVLGPGETLPPVFTPVNEIGFLAWAASQPAMFHPPNNLPGALSEGGPDADRESSRVSGYAVKRRLARAAIGAMQALQQALPASRFLHVEPLVHVVAPTGRRELAGLATQIAGWQWQAWDLLCGRLEPELGGRPGWLDVVGVNHYHSSQWEVDTEARLDWARRDPRRRPLRVLLAHTWHRYRRPLVVAETSHVGVGRGDWLHQMADEVRSARDGGVPVEGLCLYPLVDRPDWQNLAHWHRSGLWHVDAKDPALPRRVEPDGLSALRAWQQVLPQPLPQGLPPQGPAQQPMKQPARPPVLLAFSHRRFSPVQHRARRLLQALARPPHGWHVLFVEEPVHAPVARLDCYAAGPSLQVLVPYTPCAEPGFHGAQEPLLRELLGRWLARTGIVPAVAWLDTPLATPLARSLRPARLVHDCADEWAARLYGSPLLEQGVDPAVFRPRRLRHRIPDDWAATEAASVLAQALRSPPAPPTATTAAITPVTTAAATALPGMSGPWLGYAGSIDERVDLALLAALADARPQWQFMLVGPLVRVDAARLPRRANLHWLGVQPTALVPALMAHWRLALLPFLPGPTAQRLQPMPLLEALAAGLPVVAPALPGLRGWAAAGVYTVAAGEGDVGRLDAAAFVQACQAALAQTPAQAAARRQAARRRLRGRDWRALAARLHALLQQAAPAPVPGSSADTGARPALPAPVSTPDAVSCAPDR